MSSAELRDYVVRGRAFRAWRESRMDDADAEAEVDETRSIDASFRPSSSMMLPRNAYSAIQTHASHGPRHRTPGAYRTYNR